MGLHDIDPVWQLEAQAYSHPWSRGNFQDSLAAGHLTETCWDADGALLGYWVAMPGVEELHLLNIAVAPPWRRRGWGRVLLRRVLHRAQTRGDQSVWLEVRQSNHSAQALYLAEGFQQVGRRRAYYQAHRGREDAWVMCRVLSPNGPDSPDMAAPLAPRDALD